MVPSVEPVFTYGSLSIVIAIVGATFAAAGFIYTLKSSIAVLQQKLEDRFSSVELRMDRFEIQQAKQTEILIEQKLQSERVAGLDKRVDRLDEQWLNVLDKVVKLETGAVFGAQASSQRRS